MSKICLFSQFFYPSQSSTGQLITDLAFALANEGHHIIVFTGSSFEGSTLDQTKSVNSKLHVVRSPAPLDMNHNILSKVSGSLAFLIKGLIYGIFRTSRHTPLLIVSNPPYIGIIGCCFKWFRGGDYYFLLQDIFPESAVRSGLISSKGLLFALFTYLTRQVCQNSIQTIVLTDSMASFLENKYPSLKAQNKLRVIANWSIEAIPPYEKQTNPFAIEHGLDEIFTVLYSGNLGRLHDIESLAEAIHLLQTEPIQFVCIGDGPKRSLLEEYKKQHQLQNLLMLPFQPRELIPQTLTACDLSLVSLIKGTENIVAPCKLYGMLAAGRAIVSISEPGSYLDRLLDEAQCGINCPPYQPRHLAKILLELSQSPDQVKKMGKNAQQHYEDHYTFQRAVQQYSDVLQLSIDN